MMIELSLPVLFLFEVAIVNDFKISVLNKSIIAVIITGSTSLNAKDSFMDVTAEDPTDFIIGLSFCIGSGDERPVDAAGMHCMMSNRMVSGYLCTQPAMQSRRMRFRRCLDGWTGARAKDNIT